MRERSGRVRSQNMCKGPMDKNNEVGEGLNVGGGVWVEQGRVMGGKWGQLQLNNNKNIF